MPSISNPPSNANQKIITFILSAITALGLGIGSGAVYAIQSLRSENQQYLQSQQRITLTEYEYLEIGDSLKQVELILGPGIEESRSGSQIVLVWKNPDGSYIRADFDNEKLTSKQQSELLEHLACLQ